MTDGFSRNITYLRLSVTELCNLRCRYCMPESGVCKKEHSEMLTEDEMITAVRAAASLGISKVRITGGEPLVKKNILSICRRTAETDGISELCLTTNGTRLDAFAAELRAAGVTRLNLSLDTLDEEKYRYISRIGTLGDALRGLDAALGAGFEKLKLNVVLIGGFNDDEIEDFAALTLKMPVDVRFIELMPMYDSGDFGPAAYLSADTVLQRLPALAPAGGDGVAALFSLPGAMGRVGLIRPVSHSFCGSCSRIRLTPDGKLKPCLHSGTEFSVKGLSLSEMRAVFQTAILSKPPRHGTLDCETRSGAGRNMNEIGG